jgi:trehalose synthase
MKLEQYGEIAGRHTINELVFLSEKLQKNVIQMINSTAVGGGVAEILNRMVPLMNELGVKTYWDVIRGDDDFFYVTKALHNALHGRGNSITPEMLSVFFRNTEENLKMMRLNGDIIFIHDPQPIGLIQAKEKTKAKWVWRCHIDVSSPVPQAWEFIKPFVEKFDAAVFSAPQFAKPLPIRQFLIAPSIDPLSDKNKELPQHYINSVLEKYGLDPEKPILMQVSRFDRLKDPLGVIEAYKMIRDDVDCQLALVGSGATDDPESADVLKEVQGKAEDDPNIHVIFIPQNPNLSIETNALQRGATIILQKSLKEGFALTVSEALWKGKPVIASAVGGIPLQIKHNITGILVHSIEGTALAIKRLLNNSEFAKSLGENGKRYVKQNFLITRHLKDYLMLFLILITGKSGIIKF